VREPTAPPPTHRIAAARVLASTKLAPGCCWYHHHHGISSHVWHVLRDFQLLGTRHNPGILHQTVLNWVGGGF
jgi:hypothetical protein